MQVTWKKDVPFGEVGVDGDNPEHIKWICKKSLERAEEYDTLPLRDLQYCCVSLCTFFLICF